MTSIQGTDYTHDGKVTGKSYSIKKDFKPELIIKDFLLVYKIINKEGKEMHSHVELRIDNEQEKLNDIMKFIGDSCIGIGNDIKRSTCEIRKTIKLAKMMKLPIDLLKEFASARKSMSDEDEFYQKKYVIKSDLKLRLSHVYRPTDRSKGITLTFESKDNDNKNVEWEEFEWKDKDHSDDECYAFEI